MEEDLLAVWRKKLDISPNKDLEAVYIGRRTEDNKIRN